VQVSRAFAGPDWLHGGAGPQLLWTQPIAPAFMAPEIAPSV